MHDPWKTPFYEDRQFRIEIDVKPTRLDVDLDNRPPDYVVEAFRKFHKNDKDQRGFTHIGGELWDSLHSSTGPKEHDLAECLSRVVRKYMACPIYMPLLVEEQMFIQEQEAKSVVGLQMRISTLQQQLRDTQEALKQAQREVPSHHVVA